MITLITGKIDINDYMNTLCDKEVGVKEYFRYKNGSTMYREDLHELIILKKYYGKDCMKRKRVVFIENIERNYHYTVIYKMIENIILMSKKHNTKVYITTHSKDAIYALSEYGLQEDKFIRISDINGVLKEVEYDIDELKISTENNIEIR